MALADRGRVAVSDEEEVGKADDDRYPGTAGLPGRSRSPTSIMCLNQKIWLAEEQGDHEQNEQFGVRDQECAKSKDQQQNDRAPMNDDALINCGETDHPRPTCASPYALLKMPQVHRPDRKITVAGRNPEGSSELLHVRRLGTPDRRDTTSPHPHRSVGTFSHIYWAAPGP